MSENAAQIWAAAQHVLRSLLREELFNLWFAPLKAHGLQDGTLTLEVANDFSQVWLEENYLDLLRQAVEQAAGQPMKIRFWVPDHPPAAARPRSSVESSTCRRRTQLDTDSPESIFNPRNTFENFVVGSNNSFAHAAALAVAENPGQAYNPLFLYSGVGLGKTHLLHAIGQYVAAHHKALRVTYVTCEKFTNQFIEAIQNNQLVRFRRRYRQTDVFLIDDVQFLSGKERIQEEFFHTFNALHEAHKQIVLTCDRAPAEMMNLEQRLVSRFEWGMTADIQPPDMETRVAILRRKAALLGVSLPDQIIDFLAQRIRSNVRRLEGALQRVICYRSVAGDKLSLEAVEQLLRDLLQDENRHTLTIEAIQKKVAEHFDIRLADMSSKRRPEHIAFPRQIAMYLARTLTQSSLSAIGEAFGGRDHGTVLHACRQVEDRMQVDPNVRQQVEYLQRQLLR
jgi:chromosomal replication initiator protein